MRIFREEFAKHLFRDFIFAVTKSSVSATKRFSVSDSRQGGRRQRGTKDNPNKAADNPDRYSSECSLRVRRLHNYCCLRKDSCSKPSKQSFVNFKLLQNLARFH